MNIQNTATAHIAWDQAWQSEDGRAEWLTPAPDVEAAVPIMVRAGTRSVLDLGCGVGRHAVFLAALGFELSAMDASESGLDYARAQAGDMGADIAFKRGDMTDLPYEDNRFDMVLSWNVIYHGNGDVVRRSVAEIRRVLRPGGIYLGTMLSKRNASFGRGNEVAPDTWADPRPGRGDKHHPHFFCDARDLLDIFEGFEPWLIRDVEQKPAAWHWHVLMQHKA